MLRPRVTPRPGRVLDLHPNLRARNNIAVHRGQITNRHRDWHKGNHPGYNLARRLAIKADHVWLFTEVLFAVPPDE
jgi:hypothetical protein